jgi:hypothetical protein
VSDPERTAAMVEEILRGYREHAAADAEDQANAAGEDEDLGEDPDCE